MQKLCDYRRNLSNWLPRVACSILRFCTGSSDSKYWNLARQIVCCENKILDAGNGLIDLKFAVGAVCVEECWTWNFYKIGHFLHCDACHYKKGLISGSYCIIYRMDGVARLKSRWVAKLVPKAFIWSRLVEYFCWAIGRAYMSRMNVVPDSFYSKDSNTQSVSTMKRMGSGNQICRIFSTLLTDWNFTKFK